MTLTRGNIFFVRLLSLLGRDYTPFLFCHECLNLSQLIAYPLEFIYRRRLQYFDNKLRHTCMNEFNDLLRLCCVLVRSILENIIILCLHRRRLERERIGLCGVPDVWGKVHEEEHAKE